MYKDLANVGDTIRAYDFRGTKLAYIEGVVTKKGTITHPTRGYDIFDGYTINVTKDAAEFGRENDEGYVPFKTSMDYPGRVELIAVDENKAEYDLAIAMMKEAEAYV